MREEAVLGQKFGQGPGQGGRWSPSRRAAARGVTTRGQGKFSGNSEAMAPEREPEWDCIQRMSTIVCAAVCTLWRGRATVHHVYVFARLVMGNAWCGHGQSLPHSCGEDSRSMVGLTNTRRQWEWRSQRRFTEKG